MASNEEKQLRLDRANTAISNPEAYTASINNEKGSKDVDDAYGYLHSRAGLAGEQEIDIKKVHRKVDYRIIPIMFLVLGLQNLDKSLLNYAIVMGLPKDLKLKGNDLNNIASSLWWSYLAVSPLIAWAMNKMPLGKWLGVAMSLWGIVTACVAAVNNFGQLLAIRLLLGLCDAALIPALMLISCHYYRKDEQAARFAIWFSSVGFAQIIGGLISYGFQYVTHSSLDSWRIMYLVMGVISLVVGLLCFFVMPDSPMRAKFLSDAEKTALLHHVSVNQTGVTGHNIEWHQLRELVLDPQMYLLAFLNISVSLGSGILNTYSSTLIKSFGYDSKQASLLNTPGGAVVIITCVIFAFVIRYHIMPRYLLSILGLCFAFTGACMVAFSAHEKHGLQLAGIYLVYCGTFTSGIKLQWITANVAGHTKRAAASAIMSGTFSIGHMIAPYAVQPKDAPYYEVGKEVLVGAKGLPILMLSFLAVYYTLVNRHRDRTYGKSREATRMDSEATTIAPDDDSDQWKNLTDMERKSFRYVL
ncbi:hypothetical protein CERZMDRAFT_82991 [Cercospora zeae-maydis SCOH1-5]|uniref:Major facilitator superfamily (MFS) profile domain-containing protein n=1 Tax=Cercospora zeae-maydis SCOH1-5 TaxID=717836 RepID=A0A6A6FLB5_9PEZI|nr:hypothetical protein CERZMDRAFT_82991 [Cercospora zeae-maydis SCOH1-5]